MLARAIVDICIKSHGNGVEVEEEEDKYRVNLGISLFLTFNYK